MADLTDREVTEACARAMGLKWIGYHATRAFLEQENWAEWPDSTKSIYNPLTDRAQASELQERLRMNVRYTNQWIASCWITGTKTGMAIQVEADHPTSMLSAICLCAARVQIEKEKNANG